MIINIKERVMSASIIILATLWSDSPSKRPASKRNFLSVFEKMPQDYIIQTYIME